MATTVLISADMEGATGTATPEDVLPGSSGWAEALNCWSGDINAVAAALFASGVDEVLVTDAHASGSGLESSRLDPRIGMIRGRPRKFGMMEGIDGQVHAAVFLGYHGSVGSGGVLSHAFMPTGIHVLQVNGQPAGEGTINAHLAGWFGVPVILVSGDDAACEEARRYAPRAQRVSAKQALTRFTARNRPRAAVHADLVTATETAMKMLADGTLPHPGLAATELSAEIEFSSENCALATTAIPGVQQTGPRTVSYTSSDIPGWYRCLGAIWTIARSARDASYG
jgi:D-amino peptidase